MSNFDEALERFQRLDFEYAGGLANHGPMAAQALLALGHQALIPAFVDRYAPRLPPAQTGRALAPDELGAARGDSARAADWVLHFEAKLAGGDWRSVVAEVVPVLLPGLFAAAGHGLLRTVHAMRALEQEDSALRRRELARGLAYWEACFMRLPGEPGVAAPKRAGAAVEAVGAGQGAFDPIEALARWPVQAGGVESGEAFTQAVRRLDDDVAFRTAIDGLTLPEAKGVDAFLGALARGAAALYLRHADARIAYCHAVTVPAAMRWLARSLPDAAARAGAGYAFQAVAALHALYGAAPESSGIDDEVRQTAGDWAEIRYRAACSLEEHAIKLAEACWREDRDFPDPAFRLAAAEAALHLDGSRSGLHC